ncbi:S8 family serine peptidase [Vibrio crassostreae]|uniref:S8 family serine peptidase n=1 Tax=Vibrio crassostreae TaxID=246167 RepID=UPI0010540707|nr:S8 family serine peptidase [Vibrio crassostreae]TCU01352.1 integrin beta-like protein [Vibrio crassostreae]CAK2344105.1 S8 family serine peptidase [Vibrio crassostreae]CAK2817493.1 S8 family serine peptidase [Vibrio crassostreae]CAK2902027.1 S8 family serine peptidase [Vibrio crassostreae]CAK3571297.1 S8 family serine peptidase [Vibrio crassostreae]
MRKFIVKHNTLTCLVAVALLAGCKDSGGDTSTSNETNGGSDISGSSQSLLLTELSTLNGVAGGQVTITANKNLPADTLIHLSGEILTPLKINGSNATLIIPNEAVSGPLMLEAEGVYSNQDWFTVSADGMKELKSTVTSTSGTEFYSDYLIVRFHPEHDALDNAQRVAALVSGAIVGRESALHWWQIEVNADSYESLESIQYTLTSDSMVDNVMIEPMIQTESISWTADPDLSEQRDRNTLEQAADYYESIVFGTNPILPFFVAMGVFEHGLDFQLADFSTYSANEKTTRNSVTLYGRSASTDTQANAIGNHGSNVTGVIAASLGNGGNAGLISALAESHNGANITVDNRLGFIGQTLKMIRNGATVVNWSWGIHRVEHNSDDSDVQQSEVTNAALTCNGDFVLANKVSTVQFNAISSELSAFFEYIAINYPNVVIVSSAGNGMTSAGDASYRLPTSINSDQLLVVGAHTTGASFPNGKSEDLLASEYCYAGSSESNEAVKRAYYSNYGDRVDISASGTIVGFQNETQALVMGTSYATPAVAATVAMMQSINPQLTPSEITHLLRSSASPIENEVTTSTGLTSFTRPLSASESSSHSGKGARLNAEFALKAAVTSLGEATLARTEPVTVSVPSGVGEVTQTITIEIPTETSSIYDKADITFLVDISGSYSDDIQTFRSQANELVNEFSTVANDVAVGIASFSDYPIHPYGSSASGDYAYQLDLALTSGQDSIQSTLDNLQIKAGGNGPESQLEALYQLASSREVGWRTNSLPIVFLATDAGFNDADNDVSYPGHGWNDTLQALTDKGIIVFGLMSGGSIADVHQITDETGGEAFTLSRDSAEVVSAVAAALDLTTQNMNIELEPMGDFAGVVKSIVPTNNPTAPDGTAVTSVNPGDTVSFDVTFTKGNFNGSRSHVITFRLLVNVDGVATIQEVPVTISIN